MNAGLPGTGLGSLFYALSIVVMLLIELARYAAGQGNWERLALAGRQSALLLGVIVALLCTDRFLEKAFSLFGQSSLAFLLPEGRSAVESGADAFAVSTLFFTLGLLVLLFCSVHFLRGLLFAHGFLSKNRKKTF